MEHKDKVGYKILKDKLPLIRDSALDPETLAVVLKGRGIIGQDAYDYAINPLHEIRERRRKLVDAVMGNGKKGVFQDFTECLLSMQGVEWIGEELKGRYTIQ